MSIVIGDPFYIPTLNGVFLDYEITISAVSGKAVTLSSQCSNPNYRCVEKVGSTTSAVFTGTQTKTFRVNVQNRSNLLSGTDILFSVSATDSGSGYTVGNQRIITVDDRVRLFVDCNGVTVKYNKPVVDDSIPLIGVLNNGDEYYVVPDISTASDTSLVKNSLYSFTSPTVMADTSTEINIGKICTSRMINISKLFGLNVTPTNSMFIESWDTSNVTNMSYLFQVKNFNKDISKWNTSNVENMASMFNTTENFNQDISSWDTSKVTTTINMFNANIGFNQPIGEWDFRSIISSGGMFYSSQSFSQDLTKWNMRDVVQYDLMFYNSSISPLFRSKLPNSNAYLFNVDITFSSTRVLTEEEFLITFTFNKIPVLFDITKFSTQSLIISNFSQSSSDSRVFTAVGKSVPGFKGIAKLFIDTGDVIDVDGYTTISRVERVYVGCPNVYIGNGYPSDSIDAHYYYDASNGTLYGIKSNGSWTGTEIGVALPAVPDSNNVLFGESVPSSFLGENGSIFINLLTEEIYGPKTNGVWGSPMAISSGPEPEAAPDAPVFTSPTGNLGNYPSGSTNQVYQSFVSGTSPFTYTLSGLDANDFTITSNGTLFFTSPPDYLNPSDSNLDNVYEVNIIATNSEGSDTIPVSITVVGGPPAIESIVISSFYSGYTDLTGKINVDVTMNKTGLTPSTTIKPLITDLGATVTPFTLLSGSTFRSTITLSNNNSNVETITIRPNTFSDSNNVKNSDQAFSTVNFDLPRITLTGPGSVLANSFNSYQVSLSSPYPYTITLPYSLTLNSGTTSAELSFGSNATSGTLTFSPSDTSLTKTITVVSNSTSSPKGGSIVFPSKPSNVETMSGTPLTISVIASTPQTTPPIFTSPGTNSTTLPTGNGSTETPVYTPTLQGGNGGTVYALKPDVVPADDAGLFDIDAGTGVITLKDPVSEGGSLPPDADNDNVYKVVLVATNSQGVTEYPLELILFLGSATSENKETGFIGGNYSIQFVYPEFNSKSTDDVVITRSNYLNSKYVQEDLLFLIRDLIIGQLDQTSVYEFPNDTPLNRPFLFYDYSGSTTPTPDKLKLYLNKNNTVSSSVALIIDKIVKTLYSPGQKFLQYFFSGNVSNGKINRLGFKFTTKIFNGTVTLNSAPSRLEV